MKHGRGWEGVTLKSDIARRGVWHLTRLPVRQCRIWAFFFFPQICANSAWFALNWADSTRIGLYWPNWVVSAGNRNGQNGPKSVLNHAGIAKIGFEWGPNILNLSFLNFILNICYFFCVFFLFCVSCLLLSLFCESRHSNVFFKNILIVKIYRKYK